MSTTTHGSMDLSPDRFRNQKLLVQGLRLAIFLMILIFALLLHLSQSNFFNWNLYWQFYAVAGLGLLTNTLGLIFQKPVFARAKLVYASFFWDVLLISVILLRSELSVSIFLFAYMLEIVLMALVFQTRGAMLLAAFSSLCFSAVSLLGPDLKVMTFLFSLILYNVAFFAMAWIAGLLGEQLEAQGLSLNYLRALNQSIIETIPSGLVTVTSEGEVLTANPGAITLFALGDTLVGQKIQELLPEIAPTLKDVAENGVVYKGEVPLMREGDNLILQVQVMRNHSDISNLLIVLEDVTEIRRLELTLLHQQKLAAIGGLASGIAHELGNPLAAVSANIQYLEPKIKIEDESDAKLIANTHREIARLGRLIGEFKDYAKPEKVPVDPIRLDKLLRDIVELLKRDKSYKNNVYMVLDLHEVPMIRGSSDKLTQVFMNVIINAFHALDGVETPQLQIGCRVAGSDVVVKIRDNGAGMTAETKNRLFEPFFTTKGRQGTGLGLAISYKILQSHKVKVEVDSTKGQGTEFSFRFPLEKT